MQLSWWEGDVLATIKGQIVRKLNALLGFDSFGHENIWLTNH